MSTQIRLRATGPNRDIANGVLDSYRIQLMQGYQKIHEERIQMVLNPKPKWLPRRAWGWMLRLILRREFIH